MLYNIARTKEMPRIRLYLLALVTLAATILPTGNLIDDLINYIRAWIKLGYMPHVSSPRSFNEFVQSSKRCFLGDIGLARRVTDKALFKDWLEEKGHGHLAVPTLKIYDDASDIDQVIFEKNTILKPTHLSGPLIFFRESRRLSSGELKMVNKWISTNYYRRSREKTYKGILRRVMCEELLLDSTGNIPIDYKFFTCTGNALVIQVDLDRFHNHTRQFYSTDWELLEFGLKFPRNLTPIDKPEHLDHALDVASYLSRDFPLCRVDLYLLPDSVIKAGEITFFPEGGSGIFSPLICGF